jgi:hypothetical protein
MVVCPVLSNTAEVWFVESESFVAWFVVSWFLYACLALLYCIIME